MDVGPDEHDERDRPDQAGPAVTAGQDRQGRREQDHSQ